MTRPSTADVDADLVVVGFGPTGATLAGLAARRGLKVVAFDKENGIFPLPRAVQCDHEVLRVLQELGCADELMATSIVNEGMDLLSAEREVLLSFDTPTLVSTGWPASVFFHQPTFEAVLRRTVVSLGVDVRLGAEVVGLDQDADGVDVVLADGARCRARFVVGCDGARSTTRRAIGAPMDDTGFAESWLVVDLLLDERDPSLPSRCLQVGDPKRPHTLVPMPPPRFRMEFMVLPGETAEELQAPERIAGLLSPWVDPRRAEVERGAVYTFHGMTAVSWRDRRIFLAGDAAHQTPPFLGQGMCAGMRDAANLAWKLRAVLADGAPASLLDTYQSERDSHVRTLIDVAVAFGRLICLTDPAAAAERDAWMSDSRGAPGDVGDGAGTIPPLSEGPAVGRGGGRPSPQPVVDGVRLDDLVGPRFSLYTAQPLDPEGPVAAWWSEHGVAFDAVSHPQVADLVAGCPACVVRPDHYVLARGEPSAVTALAAAVVGAPLDPSDRSDPAALPPNVPVEPAPVSDLR